MLYELIRKKNVSGTFLPRILKGEKYFFNFIYDQKGCVLVYWYTKERNINELRHNSMYGYENNRNSPVYRYTRKAPPKTIKKPIYIPSFVSSNVEAEF